MIRVILKVLLSLGIPFLVMEHLHNAGHVGMMGSNPVAYPSVRLSRIIDHCAQDLLTLPLLRRMHRENYLTDHEKILHNTI